MPWTSGPTMYDSVAKEKGKVDVSSLVQPIIKNANIVPDEKPKDVAKQPSIDFSALPLSPWRRLDYTKDASQLPKPVCTFHFFYLLIHKT